MGKYYYKDVSRTCSITVVKYTVTYNDGSTITTTEYVLGHLKKHDVEALPHFNDRIDSIINIDSITWVKMKFTMPLDDFIKIARNEVVEYYNTLK